MKNVSGQGSSIPRFFSNPWGFFLVFTVTNAVLAYTTISLTAKLWWGLAGLVLPMVWIFRSSSPAPRGEKPLYLRECFADIPRWVWVTVILLSLVPRFYRLTDLSRWPFPDDGFSAFCALELCQKWSWRFFYLFSQEPPLFFWALAVFFKLFSPSLFSLWLFPALLSAVTLGISALTFRNLFSKSFSLFCLFLVGFSFWPWFNGRFCLPETAAPLWEALVFLLLSALFAAGASRQAWIGRALGLAVGIGFFVFRGWLVVAAAAVLAVYFYQRGLPAKMKSAKPFYGALFLPVVFFIVVSIHEKNGQYIGKLWALAPGMDWIRQCACFYSDIEAVFWGFDWRLLYGPVWGGLLNPLLGSFFLIGLAECWRFRSEPYIRWGLFSLAFFLSPIVAARGYDTYRIIPLLLLLVFVMAAGVQALLFQTPRKIRVWLAVFILLTSSALDYYHLFGKFHEIWGTPGPQWGGQKSLALSRAFDILDATRRERGPGAVLSELRTHVVDQTLTVAAYPFDACRNPAIGFDRAQWAAVILDAGYKPFLAARFPAGKWYWLDEKKPYGGWMLGVIPIEKGNKARLEKWFHANQGLQPATSLAVNALLGKSQGDILKSLSRAEGAMEGDRFLQTCYWEKVYTHRMIDQDVAGGLAALEEGMAKGYPIAEFYNEEGALWVRQGRFADARMAFQKAVRSPLNLTPAEDNLKALDLAGK